jgi:hypothetical protein
LKKHEIRCQVAGVDCDGRGEERDPAQLERYRRRKDTMSFNTFGWDTVYVISVDQVNKTLVQNQAQTLETLDYVDGSIKMTGQLGPWSITTGGSGKNLRMSFPITSGTFVFPDSPNADLSGVTLIADINLALLPSGTSTKKLAFDFNAVGGSGKSGPGLVTPINLLDPNNHLSPAQHAEVFGLLPAYLVQQASSLTFSFAKVDIAQPGSGSWLSPVEADYAYMEREDGSAYLGILAVTTERDISKLSREIDSDIVSGSNNAGLFIAGDLVMQHVVEPVFPEAFRGTSPSTFTYDPGSQTVFNTAEFPLPPMRKGPFTYNPVVRTFRSQLSGGNLNTFIEGTVDMHEGITMTFTVNTVNGTEFDGSDLSLAFLPDAHPNVTHQAHVPPYYHFGAGLVAAIAQLIANFFANLISDTLKDRAKVVLSEGPQLSVQWADTAPLQVTNASLDGALDIQGTLS